jgi:hypothetical protein
LSAVTDLELVEDVSQVIPNRPFGTHQCRGDLTIGRASYYQAQDLSGRRFKHRAMKAAAQVSIEHGKAFAQLVDPGRLRPRWQAPNIAVPTSGKLATQFHQALAKRPQGRATFPERVTARPLSTTLRPRSALLLARFEQAEHLGDACAACLRAFGALDPANISS